MSPTRRLRAALLASALAGLVVACFGTTRGPDFGPDDAPYLHESVTAVPDRSDEPVFRLILAGDAGSPAPEDPTLALVARWSEPRPERSRVVYLGDNVYPAGLQDEDRARGEAVLRQQIAAGPARKIFLPGNHDWGYRLVQSLTPGVLARQQAFIDAHGAAARFAPRDGCPGPEEIELLAPGDGLRGGLTLLALDLHWWLLPEEQRPACQGIRDTSEFLPRLSGVLAARRDENVVVVAHHPLRSGGPHGGHTRGFLYDFGALLARQLYSLQDLVEPGYREMIGVLSAVLAEHPPLAFAAGHDHNLQVLEGDDAARLAIVSGAASRVSGVTALDDTLFAHAQLGFVVMDFYRLHGSEGARESLVVHVVETARGPEPVFSLAMDLAREDAPAQPVAPPPAP